ncbi:hypothetical protein BGX24_000476 [Mortierella sp. AD032]|nr:hypothetical protein BGX24_000476 [Mortierella sp. AD032]
MTSRDLLKSVLVGALLLALHGQFLIDLNPFGFLFLSFFLAMLPCSPLIATVGNLMDSGRWLVYYAIWFQMMPEPYSVAWGIPNLGFEVLVFFAMEVVFLNYLKDKAGGGEKRVPLGVYLSSWVSNSRLVSYLAFHKAVEADAKDNNDHDNSNDNSNDHNDNERPLPPLPTHPTHTPNPILKYAYSSLILLFILNTLLTFAARFRAYFCFDRSPANAYEPYLFIYPDGDNFYNQNERERLIMRNKYVDYCFSSWDGPEIAPNYLLPVVMALVWSAVPTDVVVRAWMRMWNSSSTSRSCLRLPRLRKLYYILFMLPLKISLFLITLFTTFPKHNAIDKTSLQPGLLFTWSIVFTHLAKLVFGLVLIWNLYMIHSNPEEMVDLEVEIEHGLVEQWGGKCYMVVDQSDHDACEEMMEEGLDEKEVAVAVADAV